MTWIFFLKVVDNREVQEIYDGACIVFIFTVHKFNINMEEEAALSNLRRKGHLHEDPSCRLSYNKESIGY